MKKGITLVVLLALCLMSFVFGETTEIVMLFGVSYPPFYLEGPADGKTQVREGMFPEFLEVFESEYDYTIEKIRLPRKRMDLWMSDGQAQAFSLNNPMFVPDSDNYLFSDAIWHTKDVVISLESNKVEYSKPEDLFEVTVGKISGNGYGDLDQHFENGDIRYFDANTNEQLFKMLESGRIDCFIGNVHVTPYELKQHGFDSSNLYYSDKALFEFELMTQINKEYEQFRDDLNAFIKSSKENGFLEEVTQKYLK